VAKWPVDAPLLNVLQHADASRVSIKAAGREGRIRLEVSDDGNGFDPTHPSALLYHTRLHERVRAADGTLA
jgi:two-component system, NarL family, sensor histidine kinase UhpB